jgi:DNA-binding beta-propeller fold protein YncE
MKNMHQWEKRVCLLLVSTFFSLCVAGSTVFAATGTTSSSSSAPLYLSQFGSAGSGNGQINSPQGVATDSSGNVYVIDEGNNRVEKFNSSGSYITQWGSSGSGNGQFDYAYAIATNSSGDVYVADAGNYRIEEFSSTGGYITQWGTYGNGNGQFYDAEALAINNVSGNVYVVDPALNTVQEFTGSGTYITQWGSSGSGNGQFSNAYGVAVGNNGNVYVVDQNHNRIEEFSGSGTYITQWGSSGSGNGQFTTPNGIATDSSGNVYVADGGNNRIEEFSSTGGYITQWGSSGSGNGQFQFPWAVTVDLNNNIYVVDINNNRVEKFNLIQNLGTVTSAGSSNQINLTLPLTSNITSISSMPSSINDGNYSYPLGLVNFTFSTTVGATVPVTLSFQTNLTPGQVVARKYNPATQKYTTIPGAVITETTLSGHAALQLTYSISDGSSLDADGAANGIIVDPVGLATITSSAATTPSVKAPNTGYGSPAQSNTALIILSSVASVITLGLGLKLRYKRQVSRSLNS